MARLMVDMICGDREPPPAIRQEVDEVIQATTGIQAILQMEKLAEMVHRHGFIPEDRILDARGYKKVYIERLMVPVRKRIAQFDAGELTVEALTVRGVLDFLKALSAKGTCMYVFSGTDRDDVRNEAGRIGAAPFFEEIWGALDNIEDYSKEKVIKDLMTQHTLHGSEVLAVGDGPVEIHHIKAAGGVAIGVASDEVAGHGWNEEKRERLIQAGADIMIADFSDYQALADYLLPA